MNAASDVGWSTDTNGTGHRRVRSGLFGPKRGSRLEKTSVRSNVVPIAPAMLHAKRRAPDAALLEAVRSEIARCVRDGAILRIATAATRISRNFSGGPPPNTIATMLLQAGIAASVAMEIEMPEGSSRRRLME